MLDFTSLTFLKRASLAAASLLALGHTAQAQAPGVQWNKAFGGSGEDRLTVVQPTTDGGYILGGFSGSGPSTTKTDPSFGGLDYWVVKVDATGNKQWDKTFGGAGEDRLTSLQQTADGGYILGGHSASGASGSKTQPNQGGVDLWIVKIDATGTKTWDRSLGTNTDDRLATVRQTTDGGYIVGAQSDSGVFGDRSQPGNGSLDYWLLKLDATGAKTWDKSIGGSSNDILNAVRQTRDGGYILGGFSYSPASGDKSQGTRGGTDYDFWVVKVDAAGTKVWDRTLGGSGFDNLTSLTLTNDGGYVVGGFSNSPAASEKSQGSRGDYDNWIVKLSATGQKLWDFTFGGDGYDSLNGLYQTADRGYIFGSQSNSSVSGEKTQANFGPSNTPDFWVVKVDSTGRKQWDGTYGGNQDDVLNSLSQAADGSFVLGGFSNSGASGTRTQPSAGGFDFWVVKLGPVATASKDAASSSPLAIYPNPTPGQFTVQLPGYFTPAGLKAELLDATGRTVWQRSQLPAGNSLTIQPGSQPAGVYLFRLRDSAGHQQLQRVVIQ